MKYIAIAACVIAAGAIVISGHDGWGWFLLVGFLLS